MPRPVIVAHRGLHHEFPENSLSAFRAARDQGIDWVELDVWSALDGRTPMVIHDETLDRTTTGTGLVAARSPAELIALRLRYPTDGHVSDQGVRTLGDVLCVTGQYEEWIGEAEADEKVCGVLIEIKPPDAQALVKAVATTSRWGRGWMLQSFDERNLIHALVCDVKIPVAYLVDNRPALDLAISGGWDRIHLYHHLLDRATADRLHMAGVRIGAWTVNEPEDIKRVISLGVEMLITDEPLLAQAIVNDAVTASVPSSGTPGEG